MMPTVWAARNRHERNYRSYFVSIRRGHHRPRTSVLNQARSSIESASRRLLRIRNKRPVDVPHHERAPRETRQRRSDEE